MGRGEFLGPWTSSRAGLSTRRVSATWMSVAASGGDFAIYTLCVRSPVSEADNFRLHVSGYSSTAGDVLTSRGNNIEFSTKDRDNDIYGPENCAASYHGGWWYDFCHAANLNGLWGDTRYGQGVDWQPLTSYNKSATFTEMKVRVNPVVNGNTIIGK